MDDLKDYYNNNLSPSNAFFTVAGKISKDQVMASLAKIAEKWIAKDVVFPAYTLPEPLATSKVYFIDVPGAKQSVINIGNLGLAQTDPDYFLATVMNYKLGGSFNSYINTVLREEKGFTYGARSGFSGSELPGAFMASSSVRSTATLESVEIFKNLMENYSLNVSQEDLDFTKDALIKSNARNFETLRALNGMLREIGTYGLPVDYVKDEENAIKAMTLDQLKALADKYINPDKMYYVIAGDAETQLKPLEKIGFGKPELIK